MVTQLVCEARHFGGENVVKYAAHGLVLCDGCITGLRRDISELPGLYAELIREATSGTGPSVDGPGFVTGTRAGDLHPTMRYNEGAAEWASQIEHDVKFWYSKMRKERERVVVDGRVDVCLRWMLREVYWIAGSSWALDVREVCRGLVGRSVAILDPAGRPVDVAPCIEVIGEGLKCTGTIRKHGDGGKAALVCDTCGYRVPVRAWGRYGQRYMRKTVDLPLPGDGGKS